MTKDFKLPLVGLATLLLNFDRMKDALSVLPIVPTRKSPRRSRRRDASIAPYRVVGSFSEGLSDKCELSIHTISIDL